MKVCCSNGKPYDTLTDFERLGGCSTDHCVADHCVADHCVGPVDWDKWISLQINQEGQEKYKEWYDRMLHRGAICDELMEANDKLFGEDYEATGD